MSVGLGDRVKDKITGFTGIVVAVTTWLHACRRVTVQPETYEEKKYKIPENHTFDEPQLEVLAVGVVKCENVAEPEPKKKTGGPSISPTERQNVG